MTEGDEYYVRLGKHLHQKAISLGWENDGEGAYEFVSRKTYEVGYNDAHGRDDNDSTKIEEIVHRLRTSKLDSPEVSDKILYDLATLIYSGQITREVRESFNDD